MKEQKDTSILLDDAKKHDFETIVILGTTEDGESAILHTLGTEVRALFFVRMLSSMLENAILEDLYEQSGRTIN